MTPQTAAALRALVSELESESQEYAARVPAPLVSVQATLTRNIAKRLAAVLTQEGAELRTEFVDAGTVGELTVVIAHDNGAAEADAAIANINRGNTVIQHNASEMFFHQLRYRAAKDQALCKRIKVLYRDPSEKLVPIGLRFEDELNWPRGFLRGSWEKEREIQLIRKPIAPAEPRDAIDACIASVDRAIAEDEPRAAEGAGTDALAKFA